MDDTIVGAALGRRGAKARLLGRCLRGGGHIDGDSVKGRNAGVLREENA